MPSKEYLHIYIVHYYGPMAQWLGDPNSMQPQRLGFHVRSVLGSKLSSHSGFSNVMRLFFKTCKFFSMISTCISALTVYYQLVSLPFSQYDTVILLLGFPIRAALTVLYIHIQIFKHCHTKAFFLSSTW